MRLFSLLLATCLSMLAHTAACAQVSPHAEFSPVRYSSENPLRYRIADLDPRLNISQQQMVELSKQAAAIWEKDTGQNYFVYDPEAKFSINLVFDQRQIRSMKRSENLNQLEQEQQKWLNENQQLKTLKDNLTQSQTQLELQKKGYESQVQQYQQALAQFKAQGSRSEFVAGLQQQQSRLEQQAAQLQGHIVQHNQQIQQFNQQTEKLKKLHQQMAESVAQFNQTFKPEVLHKGQFEGNQISIYEFSSIDDLRLTLAHEFGHALGLKHTHNPKSLMYPRIKEQDAKDFQLTDTDLELLGLSR
ncbi:MULTISPECIES: matrixin family metalloprotease [unclassified Acinetobacter]|uniref:matrixin family metalloprotease n=1 Tax=unclassified Acinetobacter TaxID=196816 RepID=UPI00244D4698|nr:MULTISPECIES: matrixin family metalloprotease [unclassified Acinetobacter]MDH0032400.1 M10 family metallopeptidase domain-containing protein [Acinetobacter sp. GD04021]MDH0887952.1 M10 family metallopeptidase domain-containing protein [Acinetobacter sp. GD03873]MDH1084274.1 M10 family metallopeptidase domain-containing protein [Acinetobacter sp. GD03983]MDH2191306.1 M10 family metallopeptidase domain-containing protein [Acinetobacter sp. GD03645]MDH2204746.1 M10 family metallopeptidase doma